MWIYVFSFYSPMQRLLKLKMSLKIWVFTLEEKTLDSKLCIWVFNSLCAVKMVGLKTQISFFLVGMNSTLRLKSHIEIQIWVSVKYEL